MNPEPQESTSARLSPLIAAFAGAKLLIHLVTNALGGYGYFRDELYYLASTSRLDWGYVDHPPLSIAILAVNRWLLGDSLFASRLLPAVAGSLAVALIMLLARRLGGGRWAVALSGTAAIVSLIFIAYDTIYSMNAFDLVLWAAAALLLARLVDHEAPRDWLYLGLLLGFGLLNKLGVLWLGAGISVAVLATPLRRALRSRWPWIAAGVALLLFSPYVIWNLLHEMAHVEFIGNAVTGKYSRLGVIDFLGGQLLINNPVTIPLWIGGLVFLLFGAGRRYRALGIVFVAVVAVLLINGRSKPEYLAGAMTIVLAAGGVAFETWFERSRRWVRPSLLAVMLCGLLLAPLTLPILPVNAYIAWARSLGIEPHTAEAKELAELPQFYADMFGWEQKAEALAVAYHALGTEDQARAAIFGNNYGQAGAVDYFGPALGLPPAISAHNSYWIWGPGGKDGSVVLVLSDDREGLAERFEQVERVGHVSCRYCMPYEAELDVFVCRNLRAPLSEVWPEIKNFS